MRGQKNIWLLAFLVGQLLLIAIVYWPKSGESQAGKILADLSPAAVDGLSISDADNNRVELVKEEGVWQVRLADKSLYPAEKNKVERLLEKLAGLDRGRLVSSAPTTRRRFEVADDHFSRRLALKKGGEETVIFLGSSPGYRKIHLRRGDEDGIYLVRELAAWEAATKAASWWQRNYLDYDPAKITSLRVKNSHGEFVLNRAKAKSPWQMAGGKALDQGKTKSVIDELCRLTISDLVIDKAYRPKGQAIATLEIEGGVGKVVMSVWDKEKKDGDYLVKLDNNDHYARAAAYAVKRLLSAESAGLVAGEKPGDAAGKGQDSFIRPALK